MVGELTWRKRLLGLWLPLAAFVGSMIGWRGVNICIGVLAAVSALGLLLTTRGRPGGTTPMTWEAR